MSLNFTVKETLVIADLHRLIVEDEHPMSYYFITQVMFEMDPEVYLDIADAFGKFTDLFESYNNSKAGSNGKKMIFIQLRKQKNIVSSLIRELGLE